MTPVSLRRAEISDAATIHRALKALAEHLHENDQFHLTISDLEQHGFGSQPAFSVLMAEKADRFAGLCLYFTIFSTWYGKCGVYVQDLYVAPEFRGQRVGEALLARIAAEERAAGATYMRLSVDPSNMQAQIFYDRLGLAASPKEEIRMAAQDAFVALAERGKHLLGDRA
ncbi:GNAT family N-acetyltransferase [Pseudohoeflea coraliihabitans]|uniref:GNAT family N-acetyltransferase n=1 Tax=Pseudohoeflea coraliihabitans TaxID=2860393 RepID=A0ABS6WQJ5_9HYPH|nr:N-acetyltransferase [Pseudohoeflea sp. DP4N28-3]MBW3098045.1 GNAT family N-acetyltransferase [Pseudohoeflea sp. DP4N28-3]